MLSMFSVSVVSKVGDFLRIYCCRSVQCFHNSTVYCTLDNREYLMIIRDTIS